MNITIWDKTEPNQSEENIFQITHNVFWLHATPRNLTFAHLEKKSTSSTLKFSLAYHRKCQVVKKFAINYLYFKTKTNQKINKLNKKEESTYEGGSISSGLTSFKNAWLSASSQDALLDGSKVNIWSNKSKASSGKLQ